MLLRWKFAVTQILARHSRVTPTSETASMMMNIVRYCSTRSGTDSIVAATEVRTLSASCAAAADIFSSVASTSDLSIVAQPQNDSMEADDLVEVGRSASCSAAIEVGNAILSFDHSRLHEFVLGGVTRTVLGSMTVPTCRIKRSLDIRPKEMFR